MAVFGMFVLIVGSTMGDSCGGIHPVGIALVITGITLMAVGYIRERRRVWTH